MQEPGQLVKRPFYKKWQFWVIFFTFGIVMVIIGNLGGSSQSETEQSKQAEEVKKDFNQLAQERFAEIKKSAPELDSIECENNNDCNSGGSTVYLNLNKLTDDLEMVIRGNTATYSKFRMDNKKGSNVGVYARFEGKVVFQCEGSNGAVKECK